ncbi:MAG: aldo/keto reductase family protein [Oscillospiraceae bacterium]|jgi:voltage-dependent potassium channel beta subunit|nr:aldo/keto reductase family protein [Oscillospiraceae bacterium]
MQYRRLGSSGLKVSELSLGSWLTYGNAIDNEVAAKTIDKAYELGINSFDTADIYNFGEAERVVGKALGKYERGTYVLATKMWAPMSADPNDQGLSRKHIVESANKSLKRLNTEYIDILYCHRYDPNTPVEETVRALDDLIRQGKILYCGVSEWTAAQIQEAMRISDTLLINRFVVNQPQYSMLYRNIESEIIPVCESNGIGQVVFSPLAQGILTGKYKSVSDIPPDSRAANDKMNFFMGGLLSDESLSKVGKLSAVAAKLGIPLPQLALAWILRLPNISSAIIGASRPAQVEENVKASGYVLDREIIDEIEDILK